MSEAQRVAVAAPAPDAARRHALPEPGQERSRSKRPAMLGSSTPDRYRRWSVLAAGACAAAAVVGSISINGYTNATQAIEQNTGPVLVTTQTLLSSLAEADSSATAAFLSGADEDPNARRAHLDARARATSQLEDISALIGDDAGAHEALKDVADTLTAYVGLVEAARATNLAGLPVGEQYLSQAVETLTGEISEGAARLSAASAERLEQDANRLGLRASLARLALFGALIVLLFVQVRLTKTSRRILNAPLVLATVAMTVLALWTWVGLQRSQSAFDDARAQAFEAITQTAEVQTAAFAFNDSQTLSLITGQVPLASAAAAEIRGVIAALEEAADTPREASRAREALARWDQYDVFRARLTTASDPAAVQAAFGPMSQAFNGFTFTMEALQADNTDQFFDGLDRTTRNTRGLPAAVLVVPLLAGLLALAGFQIRINEYR